MSQSVDVNRRGAMLKRDHAYWVSINRALDHALDLADGARQAWLAALESESPGIAAEVRRLLAQRESAEFANFLAGNPSRPDEMVQPQRTQRRVGPYALVSELGHGGMGSVWLAQRADGQYEGQAAIKFLNAAWLGRAGQERFRREGQLLARLDHPNIARLLDAGVLEGSQPYLVLEYVEGDRIDEYCDSKRLSVPERVQLFLGVLNAVAHAHSHLIIHRDIKPANILVTHEGNAKLLDFGVARLLSEEATSLPTRAGGAALTPEYAAPEQLRGDAVTTATDVYALGIVLYVILTGRHPFVRETHSPADVMRRILETDAQRPSTVAVLSCNVPAQVASINAARRVASPRGLERALRGDLDNILMKALQRDPAERYASAGAFAEDLRRFLTHQPVTARADTAGYRAAKFMRRHRGGVAAAAAFVMTLVIAAAVTTLQMLEAKAQRDEAQFQTRRAEAANEFLNVLLGSQRAPDQPAMGGVERLNLGVELLEKQYGEDPRFAGRMLIQLGNQFRGLTDTQRAVEIYDRAFQLGDEAHDTELMAHARCAAAYAMALSAQTEGVAERLDAAKRLLAGGSAPSVTVQINCLQAQAQTALQNADTAEAIARLTQARSLLETTANTHRAVYASILTDLGGTYLETRRLTEALEMAQLVGATHERYGRGGTAARLIALQNESAVLHAMGEIRQAMERREGINRRVQQLEPAGAEPLAYPMNYVALLTRLGRVHEALQRLEAPMERARRSGNMRWLQTGLSYAGAAHLQLGELDEAQAALDEGLQSSDRNARSNRYVRGSMQSLRAEVDLARGDTAAARKRIDGMLKELDYPNNNRSLRSMDELLHTAAEVALREGRARDAESYASAALAANEAVARGPDTSADVGESLLMLARVRIADGQSAQARALLERAQRCFVNALGPEHPLVREVRAELRNIP